MNIRLDVQHKGQPKMVGKLFEYNGAHYFLHEIKKDTQVHHSLSSPGGIDTLVIKELESLVSVLGDITIVHRTPKSSWVTTLDLLVSSGVRSYQDGRDRVFLDWTFWDESPSRFIPNPHCEVIKVLSPSTVWQPIVGPVAPAPPPIATNPQGKLF